MPRTIVDHHASPTLDRPRGVLDRDEASSPGWRDSSPAAETAVVGLSDWPAHLSVYRHREYLMDDGEIDEIATAIAGQRRPASLVERAVDRLTTVLAGSHGTRSWGGQESAIR